MCWRAGDAAAALGRGTAPRPPAVFQRGGRGGTVRDPFLHSQQEKQTQPGRPLHDTLFSANTPPWTGKHLCCCFVLLFLYFLCILDITPPSLHPFSASLLSFFPRLLSETLLPAMPYQKHGSRTTHLPPMADERERCARHNERTAPWVTLITDVTIRDGALCPCAAAAILAMVLRWFI